MSILDVLKARLLRLTLHQCDSQGCGNKVYKAMEDITLGIWIELCRRHYREYQRASYPMRPIE